MSERSPSQQRLLEFVCSRFAAAWRAGQRPRLEDYLGSAAEPERSELLHELLTLELTYRRQQGEEPLQREYQQRFPQNEALISVVFTASTKRRELSEGEAASAVLSEATPFSQPGADPGPKQARAAAADFLPRLGRYQITAQLGSGGFGTVYKGFDADLQREVAIKVPHRHRLAAPEDAEAYLAEARILASLDHPGIVPVYDVGRTDDGLCYLVSKFVDGSDLKTHLQQARPTRADAVRLVAQVAEALHHAHQRGLVHRDVKPANILLDRAGHPIVADFGLALREEDFGTGPVYAGTPAYMSPEQARGEGHRVDARSDVYSLGAILYELLTGRRPFPGKSLDELLDQVLTLEPRPPRQVDDTIPKEMDRICLKAMAKRVSDRYSTALDLADDLHYWEAAQASPSAAGVGRADAAAAAATPPPRSAPSESESGPQRVVPKGLRSFEAADAEFFLALLPGPRDRDGLPESLRFWKTRIEETDPDSTFSVGLLYGPSGCGKSSLVKAGLLPRLAGHVCAVYVEATAGETEARLFRSLQKRCAGLPSGPNLVTTFTGLRRGRGLPGGQKLLLVLDQFEQWLHAQRGQPNPELVQALRQCDGQSLQCLVLVRDDFWMAATRFLRDLEIPLVEGQNAAAVDLFDQRHAHKVLKAFGRAFGALPEGPLTAAHERFLTESVAGLAQEGKVIPVRLSVFAEMVKDKPWTPATLGAVGGIAGIGVTFLEETFSARAARPEHRLHQQAARLVLQALMPEQGTDIKGHLRSYQELLQASGYERRPQDFDTVLRMLDTELRLVTPTDPEGVEDRGSRIENRESEMDPLDPRSSILDPRSSGYYQLTHDYLVPALRQWLTRKQRETVRGRAELRLVEQAALWHARPVKRSLPAWWEWANIRLFTRQRDWTSSQHQLMRQATRYHGWRGLVLAAVLAGVIVTGLEIRHQVVEATRANHAAGLVQRLLDANLAQVPGIITEIEEYRTWADPLLREAHDQAAAGSRQQLHASLALLPVDSDQVELLYRRLLAAEPHEVPVLREALLSHQDELRDQLWTAVAQPPRRQESQRLRAGSALAQYDPDNPRWAKAQDPVANDLVGVPAVYLASWLEAFRPVRRHLLGPLAVVFRDGKRRETERSLATDLLADYAADQPSVLAELLKDADTQQYAKLWPKLLPHRDAVITPLRQELSRTLPPEWEEGPLDPAWGVPDAFLERQITEAQGLVAERFALCQTLPLEQFSTVAEGLRRCGYRPIQFRPYNAPGPSTAIQRSLVAAVWTRDGRDRPVVHGVSADELRKHDAAWREKGYVPLDVASYVPEAATPPEAERYAAVWTKPDADVAAAELYVAVPEGATHTDLRQALQKKGFMPRTQTWLTHAGQTWHSGIWWKQKLALDPRVSTFRYDEFAYERALTPSQFQVDVRLARASQPPSGQQRDTALLGQAEKDLKVKPENLDALYQRAQALLRLGQDAKALNDLNVLIAKLPTTPDPYQHRALVHARLGKAQEAKADLAQFQKLSPSAALKAYAEALVATYLGAAEAMDRLEQAVAQNSQDGDFLYAAACAYGAALQAGTRRGQGPALAALQPDKAKVYAERAVALLREAVAQGYQDYGHMQTNADLDAVHDHPGFQALLKAAHLDRQYAALWYANSKLESAESHGLAPADHLKRCRELAAQGYRPVALSVLALEPERVPVTASVWHRPVVTDAAKDALALRQAQAAVALLQLGQDQLVWPLLQHSPDPRVRTYLIHRLSPLGTDPQAVLRQLVDERDVSIRRALLLCLAEFSEEQLPVSQRQALAAALLRTYRDDPDPGIHGATEWLLRRWGQAADLAKIDQELVSRQVREGRRWYINGQGQTLVLFPEPVEFWMGSPAQEPGRNAHNEPLHRKRIGRSFALATKEVTVEQFLRFRPKHPYSSLFSPRPEGPIISVAWYDAAAYCNWLSQQEGIPEAEWCYPKNVAEGEAGVLSRVYLDKIGYRLPTEAEWEYACRAGAQTSRFYGSADDLLPAYAWYNKTTNQEGARPVGLLKPNDYGLFDLYGNVFELCQDRGSVYRWPAGGQASEDKEDLFDIRENQPRMERSSAYHSPESQVRSAERSQVRPSGRHAFVGFRLARTYR